jgi:hypothetical protein
MKIDHQCGTDWGFGQASIDFHWHYQIIGSSRMQLATLLEAGQQQQP